MSDRSNDRLNTAKDVPLRPVSPIDADIPHRRPETAEDANPVPDDPERDLEPSIDIERELDERRIDRDPENRPAPTSDDVSDREPPERTLR